MSTVKSIGSLELCSTGWHVRDSKRKSDCELAREISNANDGKRQIQVIRVIYTTRSASCRCLRRVPDIKLIGTQSSPLFLLTRDAVKMEIFQRSTIHNGKRTRSFCFKGSFQTPLFPLASFYAAAAQNISGCPLYLVLPSCLFHLALVVGGWEDFWIFESSGWIKSGLCLVVSSNCN